MIGFTTYFDKNYISRGYLLVQSIEKTCEDDYLIFVFSLDDETYSSFSKLNNGKIIVIELKELMKEFPLLHEAESDRNHAEFCWTLTPFVVDYVLNKFDVDVNVYVDSDIFFWGNPAALLKRMKNESVLITEHNYSPEYDKTSTSGKFCVQYIGCRKNKKAKRILKWWQEKCLEDCSVDPGKGVCGDQKYLDDWESRFAGDIYNCRSLGCLGPWNCQKVDLDIKDGIYIVRDKVSRVEEPLVFFHFHDLKRIIKNLWIVPNYPIGDDIFRLFSIYVKKMYDNAKNSICVIESYNTAKKVSKYFILPIPYLGEDHRFKYYSEKGDNEIEVFVTDGKEEGKIVYKVSDENGKWIAIMGINGEIVFDNFHEIIWTIQKKECFNNCEDNYEALNVLLKRMKTEKVLTECYCSSFKGNKVHHPSYRIEEYYMCSNNEGTEKLINVNRTKVIGEEI